MLENCRGKLPEVCMLNAWQLQMSTPRCFSKQLACSLSWGLEGTAVNRNLSTTRMFSTDRLYFHTDGGRLCPRTNRMPVPRMLLMTHIPWRSKQGLHETEVSSNAFSPDDKQGKRITRPWPKANDQCGHFLYTANDTTH